MDKSEERLYRDLNRVDDSLIEGAQDGVRQKRYDLWVRWGLAAACLCFVAAGIFLLLLRGGNSGGKRAGPAVHAAYGISQAEYPETPPFPQDEGGNIDPLRYETWLEAEQARLALADSYRGTLDVFLGCSIPRFLSGSAGENRIYSPLNVYLALGMLAEITDGRSRQQILDVLGADSIEVLRDRSRALWNANYQDDGATTCLLAGSLWLRDDKDYIRSTLDSLAENYYASSFRGEMGSGDYNVALQAWLNEQTGGLLKEQAGNVSLDPETTIALATAICFKAGWANTFEGSTTPDTFHAAAGDVTCDFMHTAEIDTVCFGDGFTAVSKAMRNGEADMWLILPDEGIAPEDLLDGRFPAFLLAEKRDSSAAGYWSDQATCLISLSMPRFDAVSETDLIPGMKALGITDVFDGTVSDFTPLTDDGLSHSVTGVRHAARVKADEDGVEAAAYTVITVDGCMDPGDEAFTFTLDRPFLFAVTGRDGLPLFTGIVNQP